MKTAACILALCLVSCTSIPGGSVLTYNPNTGAWSYTTPLVFGPAVPVNPVK